MFSTIRFVDFLVWTLQGLQPAWFILSCGEDYLFSSQDTWILLDPWAALCSAPVLKGSTSDWWGGQQRTGGGGGPQQQQQQQQQEKKQKNKKNNKKSKKNKKNNKNKQQESPSMKRPPPTTHSRLAPAKLSSDHCPDKPRWALPYKPHPKDLHQKSKSVKVLFQTLPNMRDQTLSKRPSPRSDKKI